MRYLIRSILALFVVSLIGLGIVLASFDMAPPTRPVTKVIPNDRY